MFNEFSASISKDIEKRRAKARHKTLWDILLVLKMLFLVALFVGATIITTIKFSSVALKIVFFSVFGACCILLGVIYFFLRFKETIAGEESRKFYLKNKITFWVGAITIYLGFLGFATAAFALNNFDCEYFARPLLYTSFALLMLGLLLEFLKYQKTHVPTQALKSGVILGIISVFFIVAAIPLYETKPANAQAMITCSALFGLLGCTYYVFKLLLSIHAIKEQTGAVILSVVMFALIGVCGGVLLNYLIEDAELQGILTTIFSAILGGAITLAGVAWTIKDADAKRKEDLERIEKERKEEERKKHIPYIRVSHNEVSTVSANISRINNIDLSNYEDRNKLLKRKFVSIYRINVLLKNISSNNIILHGAFIDGTYYKVEASALIEKNSVCKIDIGDKSKMEFADEIKTIDLHISDMFENFYKINCILQYKEKSEKVEYISGDEKFYGKVKDLVIVGFTLPEFMREDV